MSAQQLDGRLAGRALNKETKALAAQLSRPPGLGVILVGEDPASQVYVRRKGVVASKLGFVHRQVNLPADVSQSELNAAVDALDADPSIDGILVQLPLPRHLDADAAIDRISPEKDVDGITVLSAGLLASGRPALVPCTPKGCMHLLELAGVDPAGKKAVVLGRSNIVGRPTARLLEMADATVTLCHHRTPDSRAACQDADIVVVAVGKPKMVQADWIKEGAVVIDVGINRLEDGTLCGDVDTEGVGDKAAAITPVPGGVGPMTIAMLMRNTYLASKARQEA